MSRPFDSDEPGRRSGRSRGRHAPRRLDALIWLRARLLSIVVYASTMVVLIVSGTAAFLAANGPSVGALAAEGGACLLVMVLASARAGHVLQCANGRLLEEQEREIERTTRQATDAPGRKHADPLKTHLLVQKMPDEIAGTVSTAVGEVVKAELVTLRGELGIPVSSAAGISHALEPLAQRSMQSILEHAAADAERQWKDILLNLTRRVQLLLHQTLKHVETLEGTVEDGALLKGIFRVDHSVTMTMRRLDTMVMRLDSSVQRVTPPREIYDVLQTAVSMIDQYKRVDLPQRLKGSILGEAAQPISLMFAELLENATSFSPPATRVTVTASPARDALRIEISDRGLPVPAEVVTRLNYLLTAPRLTVTEDVADGHTGLGTVARIARRYRTQVKLTPSDAGNSVVLLLPAQLLVAPSADPERPADSAPAVAPASPAHTALPSTEPSRHGLPTGPAPSTYASPASGTSSPPLRAASSAASAVPSDQQPTQASASPAQDQGRPPQLPRRGSAGTHMAPQLRNPRQPVQPQSQAGNYDPGLMAAFQAGQAAGENHQQTDVSPSAVRPDATSLPPQES